METAALQKNTLKKLRFKEQKQHGKKLTMLDTKLDTKDTSETPALDSDAGAAKRVAHYDLQREIGRGAMSVIYKARDTQTGEDIALKLLTLPASLTAEQARHLAACFERGVRTMARFSHPNVVAIREIGVYQGQYYLAMEYLRGQTLRARLNAGRLPSAEACLMLAQIAEVLDAIHKTWIIHRDIKPTNIMLLENGTVKLLDFGIAPSREETTLTNAGMIFSSPSCLAPEQVQGQPGTPATNIWALGVLSYEMMTGCLPFTGQTAGSVLYQIMHQPPAPTPELPAAVQEVLHRALDKHPSQRYATASALVQALKSALAEPAAEAAKLIAPQAATPKPIAPQPVEPVPAVKPVAAAPKPVPPKPTAPKHSAPQAESYALPPRSAPRWLPGAALPLLFLLGFCGAFLKWHHAPDAVRSEAAGQTAQKTALPSPSQAPVSQVSLPDVPSPQPAAAFPPLPEAHIKAHITPRPPLTARVSDSSVTQHHKYPVVQANPVVQASLESAPPRPSLLSHAPAAPRRAAAILKQTAQHISAQHSDHRPMAQKGTQPVVLVKAAAPQLLVRSAAPQVPAQSVDRQTSAQKSDQPEPAQSTEQGFTLPSESPGYDPEADARLRKSAWSQNGAASSP